MTAKTSSLLAARLGPSVGSVLVHVAAVTAFAGHAALSPASGAPETPTEIAIVADELVGERPVATAPNLVAPIARTSDAPSPHTHHHTYPVAPDHDAKDHDPSLVHAPLGAAPPPAEASETAPLPPMPLVATAAPRFKMSFGGPSNTAAARQEHAGDPNHDGASIPSASTFAASETVPESSVSRPARLLACAGLAYPAEARAAEVEADVPLELVVDVTGAVIDARVLHSAGLGLDAAALTAVRRYRFTPAERGGHPVRVRMRWSVEFRLR